jgi:hypothetical protein
MAGVLLSVGREEERRGGGRGEGEGVCLMIGVV